jgi:hypothetical protein
VIESKDVTDSNRDQFRDINWKWANRQTLGEHTIFILLEAVIATMPTRRDNRLAAVHSMDFSQTGITTVLIGRNIPLTNTAEYHFGFVTPRGCLGHSSRDLAGQKTNLEEGLFFGLTFLGLCKVVHKVLKSFYLLLKVRVLKNFRSFPQYGCLTLEIITQVLDLLELLIISGLSRLPEGMVLQSSHFSLNVLSRVVLMGGRLVIR